MKKNRLFVVIGALSIAIAGSVFALALSHTVNAATQPSTSNYVYAPTQLPTNSDKYQFVSDIKESTLDIEGLSQMGITIENTSTAPTITPQEAAETASNECANYASQATNIAVEYYEFTDPNMRMFSPAAMEKNQSLAANGYLLDTPCYIVSFKGITKPAIVPPDFKGNPPVNHEYNLVIDANSGEPLFGFTYR